MGEEKNARNIQFQDSRGKYLHLGQNWGVAGPCRYVNHDSIVNGFGTIFIQLAFTYFHVFLF